MEVEIKKCSDPFSIALKTCKTVSDYISVLNAAKTGDAVYIENPNRNGYEKKEGFRRNPDGEWEMITGITSCGKPAFMRPEKEIVTKELIAEKAVVSRCCRIREGKYEVMYISAEYGRGASYFSDTPEAAVDFKKYLETVPYPPTWRVEIVEY